MRKIAITAVFTLLFGMVALAQSSSPQYPSNPNNPNNPMSRPQSTTPSTMPSTSPEAQQTQSSNETMKAERKLRGCIVSENGQFFLEKKNGEKVELSSTQDLSAHVGHTVAVHGTMEGRSSASAPSPSSSTGSSSTSSETAGGKFVVSKLDMVSESCTNKK